MNDIREYAPTGKEVYERQLDADPELRDGDEIVEADTSFEIDRYQVVRREFISHRFDPAITICGNSVTFNNSCISKLESVTYVQILINPTEHKLAIRPCDEGARDAVRWCVVHGEKRKSRKITCQPFTSKLYELMDWESPYRYKLQGMRISYKGESLYLFDLSSKEAFLPQSRDPETGKVKRPKPILPSEWLETFGMTVDEHTASTQIDLTEGFITPVITEQPGETPTQPVMNRATEVTE